MAHLHCHSTFNTSSPTNSKYTYTNQDTLLHIKTQFHIFTAQLIDSFSKFRCRFLRHDGGDARHESLESSIHLGTRSFTHNVINTILCFNGSTWLCLTIINFSSRIGIVFSQQVIPGIAPQDKIRFILVRLKLGKFNRGMTMLWRFCIPLLFAGICSWENHLVIDYNDAFNIYKSE